MKHITVALFVPHKGCPHQCSFCNQKSISGESRSIEPEDIRKAVLTAEKNPDLKNAEIAFFGGSFTAIPREYMLSLLEAAAPFIDGEKFKGIRISTRPDAVDEEICEILKKYRVSAVELGAQSMNDEVLLLNKRGHSVKDIENAFYLLKEKGFETGLQMMTGLYGSNKEKDIETGRKIIALHPDTVRIYPTVVIESTPLAELYRSGEYIPQSVEEAAEICSELIPEFENAGIKIIRVGLHSGGGVDEGYLGGAYHPAFKEICESKIYLKKIKSLLPENKREITIAVPRGAISQAVGQKRTNIEELNRLGYKVKIVQNEALSKYQVLIK